MDPGNKGLRLRILLIFFVFIFLILGAGYKYYEWSTVRQISDLQSSLDREELTLVEQNQEVSERAGNLFSEILSDEKSSYEDRLKKYDELTGVINLARNNYEEYLNTVQKNDEKYEKLRTRSKFLFGKQGNFIKSYLNHQQNYYDSETESARETLISNNMGLSLINSFRDYEILNEYDKAGQKSESNFSKNFSNIIILEKYSKSDFKYPDEERIKELNPYGYEVLNKYKDLFASYYSVTKDYVSGDKESATYKYSKLQDAINNINVDYERFVKEGEERSKDRSKKILTASIEKISLIKDFKEKRLGVYPLLPEIKSWKEDLFLCQLYAYKTSYYQLISNKYPNAKEFDSLLGELNELPPKSDKLDNQFDKGVVKYSNDDKKISFNCTDKDDGKSFNFNINK